MKLRVLAIAVAGAAGLLVSSGPARATGVSEFPDNGSEQMARGGAWVARASDPLATIFNPAGLAGQPTRLTIQNNTIFEHTCFTRVKAASDTTNDPLVGADGTYPRACNDISPTINPQLGMTIKLGERLGLGLLVIGPSSGGQKTFPDFVTDANGQQQAAPGRYLLIEQKGIILFPTVGLGYEILENLRVGASFSWGFARLNLTTASTALNTDGVTPASNDARATIQVHDYFVPGFTLGTIWSATPKIDIAGWYKWSDAIRAGGDAGTVTGFYGSDAKKIRYGDTLYEDCGTGNVQAMATKPCGSGNNASLKFAIPMEAKIGFRYHQPRAIAVASEPAIAAAPPAPVSPATPEEGPPAADLTAAPPPPSEPTTMNASSHVRDPLATDVFDLEADLTWANNSALDNIEIRFPGDATGKGTLPVAGVSGEIPPNADQKRGFKDVFGIRVGGDFNVIADKLALRAGTFFETSAANPQYQNVDFAASSRFGLAGGATYRFRFGAGEKTSALELMVGYGHVFFAEQSRTDPNASGSTALAGTSCNGNGVTAIPGTQTCSDGNQRYRTKWPVNLGTITNSVNVINVGVAYRF